MIVHRTTSEFLWVRFILQKTHTYTEAVADLGKGFRLFMLPTSELKKVLYNTGSRGLIFEHVRIDMYVQIILRNNL